MQALRARDVLDIIEWGAGHSPTRTVLYLLGRADTGQSAEQLEALPLGARDRLLLELRKRSLASPMVACEQCPRCDAALEIALDPAGLVLAEATGPAAELSVHCADLEIRFRLPNSGDLLSVEGCSDEDGAVRTLALRCVRAATRGEAAVAPHAIDAQALQRLNDAIAEADPQADLNLDLTCTECGHAFQRELDVASFFIQELVSVSRHLLHEVYALARGYGFSESDILDMSAWRRRAYLEMLAA